MKVTKTRLKQIIAEEMNKLKELGPETGHAEGTDAAGVVRQVAADLEEAAEVMSEAPSTTTASEFAGFIQSKAQELSQAADELGMDGPRPVAEGDDHSRTITQIEKIGDEIVHVAGMVDDPAVLERLEMLDEMITDLVAQMQGVESAPLPHMAVDGAKSVPQ